MASGEIPRQSRRWHRRKLPRRRAITLVLNSTSANVRPALDCPLSRCNEAFLLYSLGRVRYCGGVRMQRKMAQDDLRGVKTMTGKTVWQLGIQSLAAAIIIGGLCRGA